MTRSGLPIGSLVDLLERRPGEQQSLFTDSSEADQYFGLVSTTGDFEHRTFTETVVKDVVADSEVKVCWGFLRSALPETVAGDRRNLVLSEHAVPA